MEHPALGEGSRAAPQADPELSHRLQADPELHPPITARSPTRRPKLITEGITRITRDGIVTDDGREHPADVIVYATGFHVTDSYTYVQIKGQHGEDLVDRWNREGIGAHRGITVADVPNLFFLLGPNTGLGHNSVVFMIESQIRYVADAIAKCDKMERRRWPRSCSAGPVQRRAAGTAGRGGVEQRRLQQLVPRRARQEHRAVGRLHLAVLAGYPLGEARRSTSSSGSARARAASGPR